MNPHYFLEYITNPARFDNYNLPSFIYHMSFNNTDIQYCGAISIDFLDHTLCIVLVKSDLSIDKIQQTKNSSD